MVDSIDNWSFEEKILSAEDLAAVKIAIQICNGTALKRDILCAPGSDYDIKKKYRDNWGNLWHKMIQQKAAIILEKLGLPKRLIEKLVVFICSIGMRMLIWAEYHEAKVGFSREYSINVLTSSFFTMQGSINNKKAAEKLLKDKSLSKKEQYKLACLYCLVKHIPDLFQQMSNEDKRTFYGSQYELETRKSELIEFWSSYMPETNDLNRGIINQNILRTANRNIFQVAIRSGNKAAIEYCLDELRVKERNKFIVKAAVAAISQPISYYSSYDLFEKSCPDPFHCYAQKERYWIPTEYYADILFYLLSIMREDQQIELLKKDVDKAKFYVCKKYIPRSLYYFLNWPYQNYFMKTAKLMWEFLPEKSFAVMLLIICDKIEVTFENYSYRKLLTEFWCQSPEQCKRYVFNKEHGYFKKIIERLFTLTVFTDEDMTNIDLMLASASKKEKKLIFSFENAKSFCFNLVREEKWDKLKEFLSAKLMWKFLPEKSFAVWLLIICKKIHLTDYNYRKLLKEFWCQSPEHCKRYVFNNKHGGYFKKLFKRLFFLRVFTDEDRTNIDLILASASKKEKKLIFSLENATYFCFNLVQEEKWDMVERFISICFSSKCFLPEKEITELEKERIHSEFKRRLYLSMVPFYDSMGDLHDFLQRCIFFSVEETKTIKEEFVFSSKGISVCTDYIYNGHFELFSKFIDSNLCSDRKVREFKKLIAYYNNSLWKMLITGVKQTPAEVNNTADRILVRIDYRKAYIGGKWEQMEKLLTWCFSSEAEKINFKKNHLFKLFGVNIIPHMIASCKVQEAERFLAWIGLSFEEIRELKLKALFSELGMAVINEILFEFEYSHNSDTSVRCDKGETYLKWCFIDIDTLLEFKKKFDEVHGFKSLEGEISEGRKNTLNRFYILIERLINDFTLKTEGTGGRESKMSKK